MAATCAGCAKALSPDARFCPSCGTQRASGSDRATDERRLATVLIGDLVGFTTIAESLDPEMVKNLVDRVFSRLADDVTAHGGTVDKVVGDAIVALFGAPVAHEDDPERAVRAALVMQQSVVRVGSELGVDLAMRIGVNTGEVLVGGLAAGDNYTAMGDAVNIASRLESAAEPGTVLVGPLTHAATAATINYASRGRVTVRGRVGAVESWVAVNAIGQPGNRQGRMSATTVGRDAEAALLDSILALTTSSERAHLVELTGDAGVGKQQVAWAFLDRAARERGALVMHARVAPYGEASMWAPAAALLCSAVDDDVDLADPNRRRATVAAVFGLEPDSPKVTETSDALAQLFEQNDDEGPELEHARSAAVRAVASLVAHLARSRPVVTMLANAQWADPALLRLMADVLLAVRLSPVVAVLTTRDDGHHQDDLGAMFDDLTHTINTTWVRLAPLGDDATLQLARRLLGVDAPEAMVAAAIRRSGGNPLMLEEIAALSTHDAVTVDAMPQTLRGLMSARLDQLSEALRPVVDHAAMIGYTGPVSLLEDLLTDTGHALTPELRGELQRLDLFVIDDEVYRFKTDALREAAYLRLPKGDRVRRHVDIADRMLTISGAHGTRLRRRAQHLAIACETAAAIGTGDDALRNMAVEALRAAAAWASGRDASVALAMADRALALVAAGLPADTEAADPVRVLRARALFDLHRRQEAVTQAQEVVDRTGQSATSADAVRALAGALVVIGQVQQADGRLQESADTLQWAVDVTSPEETPQAQGLALRELGLTHIFAGQDHEASTALESAIALYTSQGDAQGLAWAEQHLGWVRLNLGDLSTATSLAESARAAFLAEGDEVGAAISHGLEGWIEFFKGDLDRARAGATLSLSTAGSGSTHTFGRALSHLLLASVDLWRGQTTRAHQQIDTAIEHLDALGHRWAEMLARLIGARVHAHLGEPSAALAQLSAATAAGRVLTRPGIDGFLGPSAAAVHLHIGQASEAHKLLSQLDEGDAAAPDHHRLLALTALQQGDHAAIGLVRQSLAGDAGPSGDTANRAAAALILGWMGQEEAREEARSLASQVLDEPLGTFHDTTSALLGLAVLHWREGDADGALDAVTRAARIHAVVEDHPTAAVVDLIAHLIDGSMPGPDAVRERLQQAGVIGDGWQHAIGTLGRDV